MRDGWRTAAVEMRFQITWFHLTEGERAERSRSGPPGLLSESERGNRATDLSSYVMSQVQCSPAGLFKARPSRVTDKKVIYLVAAAPHQSLGPGYFGGRQTPGCRFW